MSKDRNIKIVMEVASTDSGYGTLDIKVNFVKVEVVQCNERQTLLLRISMCQYVE